MKFKKPKFWDYNKPNILSYLFFPVSLLLTILRTLKNLTTKKKKYSKIKTILRNWFKIAKSTFSRLKSTNIIIKIFINIV